MPCITALAGSGALGYFADENGQPRLGLADNPWALIPNAGRWNGGDWQADMDGYFDARGTQGFTAIYLDPYGNQENGCPYADGRTWDGIYPFNSGSSNDPSSGLNDEYYARVDYALAAALRNGITIFLNIAYSGGTQTDMEGSGCLSGKTSTQYADYGTNLAGRYAATPNLMWVVGNDYFDTFQASFASIKTGLRDGGAAQPFMVHNMPESTSRFTLDTSAAQNTGTALSEVNWTYSYDCWYLPIEYAYTEASPLPVVLGDGYFYASSSNTYDATLDRAARQELWWALASGARFVNFGSEGIWQWDTNAAAQATGEYFYTTQAGKIRLAVESLTNWHQLIPDTSNQLITSGRGTRNTQYANGGGHGQYEPSTANSYVAASRVADGSLALIYLPNAATITIDQTKMAAGWQAKWMDPLTCVTYSGTKGGTFNSGATDGSKPVSNSAGQPDWVLVLAQPPYATWTIP